jgi:hypothetical protein
MPVQKVLPYAFDIAVCLLEDQFIIVANFHKPNARRNHDDEKVLAMADVVHFVGVFDCCCGITRLCGINAEDGPH